MKKGVKVSGIDHSNSFLLGSHALINEVTSDLKSSLCGSLTISGLKHIELAVLNGELHILHVSVVLLKGSAYILELCECFRELLFHLGDVHRSSYTCNNVLALCVGKELTEEALSAGSGISGECNTGSAIIAHVTESHGLYVYSGTP